MILQVGSHVWQVNHWFNPHLCKTLKQTCDNKKTHLSQMILVTNTREKKDLRSSHRSCTQNHLTARSQLYPLPKPLVKCLREQVEQGCNDLDHLSTSTPLARPASISTLVTCAWVSTVRFCPANRSANAL